VKLNVSSTPFENFALESNFFSCFHSVWYLASPFIHPTQIPSTDEFKKIKHFLAIFSFRFRSQFGFFSQKSVSTTIWCPKITKSTLVQGTCRKSYFCDFLFYRISIFLPKMIKNSIFSQKHEFRKHVKVCFSDSLFVDLVFKTADVKKVILRAKKSKKFIFASHKSVFSWTHQLEIVRACVLNWKAEKLMHNDYSSCWQRIPEFSACKLWCQSPKHHIRVGVGADVKPVWHLFWPQKVGLTRMFDACTLVFRKITIFRFDSIFQIFSRAHKIVIFMVFLQNIMDTCWKWLIFAKNHGFLPRIMDFRRIFGKVWFFEKFLSSRGDF